MKIVDILFERGIRVHVIGGVARAAPARRIEARAAVQLTINTWKRIRMRRMKLENGQANLSLTSPERSILTAASRRYWNERYFGISCWNRFVLVTLIKPQAEWHISFSHVEVTPTQIATRRWRENCLVMLTGRWRIHVGEKVVAIKHSHRDRLKILSDRIGYVRFFK